MHSLCNILALAILYFIFFTPLAAHAYIGPGIGAGVISLIVGVLFTIFLAVFGIFYYPIKKLVKKIKKVVIKK